jgi:hypothetical protein
MSCLGLVVLAVAALPAPAPADRAGDLVRRLGSPSFAERERASQELVRLGPEAVTALQAGCDDEDSEVRSRSRRLLPLARRTPQQLRLAAFLLDTSERLTPPLGGWLRFRNLVGSDSGARDLFADMYAADGELLELLDKDPRKAGSQIAAKANAMQQKLHAHPVGPRPVRMGEVAVLMFAAAEARASLDANTSNILTSLLYQPGPRAGVKASEPARRVLTAFLEQRTGGDMNAFLQVVYLARNLGMTDFIDEVLKPAARKQIAVAADARGNSVINLSQALSLAQLLELRDAVEQTLKPAARRRIAEAAKSSEQNQIQQALFLARSLELREGVGLALTAATQKKFNAFTRGTALVLVGRLGTRDHVAHLEPLFEDRTAVGQASVNNLILRAELRDVALAAAVRLSGQKAAEYDFPYFKAVQFSDSYDVPPSCYGFETDAQRQAAFRKWKDSRVARPAR